MADTKQGEDSDTANASPIEAVQEYYTTSHNIYYVAIARIGRIAIYAFINNDIYLYKFEMSAFSSIFTYIIFLYRVSPHIVVIMMRCS